MQTVSSIPSRRRRKVIVVLCLIILILLPLAAVQAAMTTENFESEAIGTTFSENTLDFSVTGDFGVTEFATFGCCPSDKYLDTGFGDGATVGSAGTIQLTTANHAFRVGSFDVWTSHNDGANEVNADVTFIGTLKAGGTESALFTIQPTGFTGTDWDHVSFAGTNLDGKDLVQLEIIISAPANFVALDNFEFEGLSPTAIRLQAINADTNLNWANLGLLLLTIPVLGLAILYWKRSLFDRAARR